MAVAASGALTGEVKEEVMGEAMQEVAVSLETPTLDHFSHFQLILIYSAPDRYIFSIISLYVSLMNFRFTFMVGVTSPSSS